MATHQHSTFAGEHPYWDADLLAWSLGEADSYAQLAEEWDAPVNTIRRWARKHDLRGIERLPGPGRATVRTIADMAREGRPAFDATDISERTEYDPVQVGRWIREAANQLDHVRLEEWGESDSVTVYRLHVEGQVDA